MKLLWAVGLQEERRPNDVPQTDLVLWIQGSRRFRAAGLSFMTRFDSG